MTVADGFVIFRKLCAEQSTQLKSRGSLMLRGVGNCRGYAMVEGAKFRDDLAF